jgi:transposase
LAVGQPPSGAWLSRPGFVGTLNVAKVGVMPAPRKYPDEVRERAVRMVFEIREESGQQQGAIARVADRLGINRETLGNWVKQAEVDAGKRPGTSTVDSRRIAELEREVRELRRANEILKAASAFFARELDPRLPK